MTVLHVEKVDALIQAKGLKKVWVIDQLGMPRSSGWNMLKNGVLPKDPDELARVLRKLAELLDLGSRDLVVQVGEGSARVG